MYDKKLKTKNFIERFTNEILKIYSKTQIKLIRQISRLPVVSITVNC